MKSGIIIVNKEAGYTSFDVVARLRGILKIKKIGHTGTLDPSAVGVLPVCIGKATRVCELLTDRDKTYEAVLRLGIETDTQDMTGKVLAENEPEADEEKIRRVILSFIGEQEQIPPMYSALKVNGQKLCDLARQGKEIERQPRKITIHDIQILKVDLPHITMAVHCSKGTYIRTLCHDIGRALGCGGCMETLVRTRAAGFSLEEARRLDEIEQLVRDGRIEEEILPIDHVFFDYPKVVAKPSAGGLLENGNRIGVEDIQEMLPPESGSAGIPAGDDAKCINGVKVRMYLADGRFVGIFQKQERYWNVVKMFLE